MRTSRVLLIAALTIGLSSLVAGDLSRYRNFQLESSLAVVAKQAGIEPARAAVLHQNPAFIQELVWQPVNTSRNLAETDSLKEVQFRFYNGELFRIVVSYDRYRTEGLTAKDLMEAISATYGPASTADGEMILDSIYDENETVKILARWQDAKYSLNLVRSAYQSGFTLVAFSRRLEPLARAATLEAVRLEKEQAPQKEIDRQNREDADKHTQQEKARVLNKPGFRP